MSALSILAMAMIIYLFGGYVESAEAQRGNKQGKTTGQTGAARIAQELETGAEFGKT
jgi:hypothetical protein